MKHIPYGYEIVDGKAIIIESRAKQVQLLFTKFLEGESLVTASKSSSLNLTHSQIGRLLEKKDYCGTDFYPPIISVELFKEVQEERKIRAQKLGRVNKAKPEKIVEPDTTFKWKSITQTYADPFEQAEYLYGQIGTEVQNDE